MPQTITSGVDRDPLLAVFWALLDGLRSSGLLGNIPGAGNVSMWVEGDSFRITPKGADLSYPTWPLAVSSDGESWDGVPSTEVECHHAIYRATKEADFVAHIHSPNIVAACAAPGNYLPMLTYLQAYLGEKDVPVLEFFIPGSRKLAEAVEYTARRNTHALLMRNHGAFVWARDAATCLFRCKVLEEACRITLATPNQSPVPEAMRYDLNLMMDNYAS